MNYDWNLGQRRRNNRRDRDRLGLKKVLTDKYVATFWTALGLAALGVGAQTVVANPPKSHYPVLFIISLAIGLPVGTWLKLDDRANAGSTGPPHRTREAVATASFLDCIGALAILGPVNAAVPLATKPSVHQRHADPGLRDRLWGRLWAGDDLEVPVLFIWFTAIYLVASFVGLLFLAGFDHRGVDRRRPLDRGGLLSLLKIREV